MTATKPTSGTSGDAIARAFLASIGAPDTPLMRKAVIAWIRAESGNTVRAGNPWNISYAAAQEIARKGGPQPIASWTSSTGQKFAVYPTAISGAQAAGKLLLGAGNDWRGYAPIVAAARRSDPIGFLNALARSAWDAGRYGTKNGGSNKLLSIYASVTGNPTFGSSGGTSGGGSFNDPISRLGGWGNLVSFPTGHILTGADIDTIMAALDKGGFFDPNVNGTIAAGQGRAQTDAILRTFIGQPWNKATQDAMQARFFSAATQAGSLGDAVGAIAGTIGDVARAALDPGHWVRFLALFVGAGFVAYGGIVILRSAGAPAPSLPALYRPGIVEGRVGAPIPG